MSRDRDRVAFHEASHAVAALRLGARVDLVVLASHAEPGELPDGAVGVVHRGALDLALPDEPERTAIISLSGLEAERRRHADGRPWSQEAHWRSWWPSQLADRWQIHDVQNADIGDLCPGDDQWVFVEGTIDLVDLWWEDVDAVACRLIRCGRMEGTEVLDMIGPPTQYEDVTARLTLLRMRSAAI